MTLRIRTSWILAQTQQRRDQTNGFQSQNLTTRTFRSSHLEVYFITKIKTKFLKTNRKGVHSPGNSFPSTAKDCRPTTTLQIKSTTTFFNDLDAKFGTVNYGINIWIIATTENLFLYGCFWSCRNLHSWKSTTRKSTFGSSPPDLIWKKILSKSGQNSWKTSAKELTLQQSCRLEACSCTKNEPSHSHFPRILPRSWVIIYDCFKNLRKKFIPEYFSIVASIYYAFFLL